jgi:hypothetical protein
MVEGKSANGRRYGGRRRIAIAQAGACLLVAAALAAPAVAAERDRERSAQPLWDAYPLHSAGEVAAPAPPAEITVVNDAASGPSAGGGDVIVLLIAAVVAGAVTAQVVSMRRSSPRAVATATGTPDPVPTRSTTSRLWARAAPLAPAEPVVPLANAPPAPSPRSPVAPAPPDPDRAWAAEIEWHLIDGGSQFRITARPVDGGAEPITLGASEPLDWPPRDARAVQALTDAVRTLESALVATGWSALPRGTQWYAKRYAWQPGARPRPALATGRRSPQPGRHGGVPAMPGQMGSLRRPTRPWWPESGRRGPPPPPTRG